MHTRSKSKLFVAAVAVLPLFFVVPRTIGQQEAPIAHPYIIFIGTVDALNAVAVQSLKASPNTSIVVVEKVLKKPDAVALAPSDRVTVLAEENSTPLQKGVRGLFITEGMIYGASLAVRMVSWEPAPAVATAATQEESRATAKLQELTDKALRESIQSVEMVVVGRVKEIRAASAVELTPNEQRISEHNPEWQEAIVEVQEMLKGPAGISEIVVRFPASQDIMWVGYPKLKTGQESTLLLRQDQISGASKATLGGQSVTAYMAITRKDVLQKADSQSVKRVLNTP
jgi:hypothetical protein